METTLDIDWDMYGLLQNKYFKNGTHFSKFVHYKLPTNDKLNKYKQFQDSLCPRCRGCEETRYHLFQCQSSKECQNKSIIFLEEFNRRDRMDNKMVDIWVKGLKSFFEDGNPTLSNIPGRFKQVVNAQKIGMGSNNIWKNFISMDGDS